MVEPKPMVQADEAPSESQWASQPVYIANVGGGWEPGPDGVSGYNDEMGYEMGAGGVNGQTEEGNWGWELQSALLGFTQEGYTVQLTPPSDSGTFATEEWVQAQIAAALA